MKKTILSSIVAAWLLPFIAQSQIVQFDFTDTNATAQSILSSATSYLNPSGQLNILTLAGLDRKIQLTIKNSSNTAVFDQTSSLVTVTDRLTDKTGNGFYGKTFNVPSLAEGSYTATSKVIDSSGNEVSTNSYTFTVDITPPKFSGTWHWAQWARDTDNMPDDWLMGPFEARRLWVDSVTDSSPIVDAKFYTKTKEGVQKTSTAAIYDSASSQVGIGTNAYYSVTNGGHFPAEDGPLIAGFTIKDKAGNTTTLEKPVRWNGVEATPYELVAVHNPNFSGNFLPGSPFNGFEAVTASTKIHENPWSAVYRVKKTDWWQYNDYGFSVGYGYCGDNPDFEDDTYVYKIVGGVYQSGQMPYHATGTCSRTSWRTGALGHNLSLADDTPQSPKIIGVQSLWSNSPEWQWVTPGNQNKAISLLGARVVVEPRNYVQIFYQAGHECTIQIGETECSATFKVDFPVNATPTIYWSSYNVHNESATLVTSNDINFTIDGVAPTIQSAILGNDKVVTIEGIEPDTGASWGSVAINTGFVRATDANGVVKDIPASEVIKSGSDSFTIKVPVSSLPDGNYTLVAFARDNYSNETSKEIEGTYAVDNTPPELVIDGIVNGYIQKLSEILITLKDNVDQNPTITSVTLKGGPLNDYLSIGFNKQQDGFHLELPRMFPSLDDTQIYTLTITAQDAQGNKTTATQKFLLTPENLVALGTIKALAVNKNLLDSKNVPLTYAKITTVKTAAGATATGAQQAYFTLRRDAAFAVIINGVTVQPGESKDFTLTLDNTGGAVLPIYPATSGKTGNAAFMIDIPQLVTN